MLSIKAYWVIPWEVKQFAYKLQNFIVSVYYEEYTFTYC